MELLNAIFIAGMCVASAFGGFILCMKVRKPEVRHVIRPLLDNDADKEIEERAMGKPINIETAPVTAEDYAKRFRNPSASERLKHGTS